MRLIDAEVLEKEGWTLSRIYQIDSKTSCYETKAVKDVPTIEPDWTKDLIKRQDAINELKKKIRITDHDEYVILWDDFTEGMRCLPPAQPERVTAEWMFEEYPDGYYHSECTACGAPADERAYLDKWKYCPKCGARMRIDDY